MIRISISLVMFMQHVQTIFQVSKYWLPVNNVMVLLSILEIKSCIIIVIPKEIFIGTIIDNGELEKIIV